MGRIQGKEIITVKRTTILERDGKWHFLISKPLERAGIVVSSPHSASSVSQFQPTPTVYINLTHRLPHYTTTIRLLPFSK